MILQLETKNDRKTDVHPQQDPEKFQYTIDIKEYLLQYYIQKIKMTFFLLVSIWRILVNDNISGVVNRNTNV